MCGNFGYMGRSNPWDNLDQMRHVADMVDVITCVIFGDCQLRSVHVVRGVILPSPIDEVSSLQHWSQCDCVIIYKYRIQQQH